MIDFLTSYVALGTMLLITFIGLAFRLMMYPMIRNGKLWKELKYFGKRIQKELSLKEK